MVNLKKKLLRVGILLLLIAISLVLFGICYYFSVINTTEKLEYYAEFFDDNVHKIDIKISDFNWNDMIENPIEEEYHSCDIIIDGQKINNVGIRTKGNTSLSNIADSGISDRYSFKINFGKYEKGQTFYGLDEVCFNNLYADATYMKEYLSYDMFEYMGVPAPLCTFVNISINGQPWGLYVAVESVDESFLKRNFGEDYGELYKPESSILRYEAQNGIPEGTDIKIMGEDLVYIDDNFDSYYTVFDTAKTDITDEDKIRLINSIKILNTDTKLSSVVSVENTLKFWVVNNLISNYDSYIGPAVHNYYLYEENGVLTMIPWDYNLSFGAYQHDLEEVYKEIEGVNEATRMINLPILNPIKENLIGYRPFFEKIVIPFEEEYIKIIDSFISVYFDSGYFNKYYIEMINKIKPYIENDKTAFYTIEEVNNAQNILKEFIDLRIESIKGQLDGSVIHGNYSTYIDASYINLEEMGHQKDGYVHIKDKGK